MARDMSEREFAAALKRHGLVQKWLWIRQANGRVRYGLTHIDGKILYRQSLARILKQIEKDNASAPAPQRNCAPAGARDSGRERT